jgi:hypothetical protein
MTDGSFFPEPFEIVVVDLKNDSSPSSVTATRVRSEAANAG